MNQRAQQLPKLSHQQSRQPPQRQPLATDTPSMEKLFDALVSRLEDRFDRLATVMESGLEVLANSQQRALKKFCKMSMSMEQMVKLMSNPSAIHTSLAKEKDSEVSELDNEKHADLSHRIRQNTEEYITAEEHRQPAIQAKPLPKVQVKGKLPSRKELHKRALEQKDILKVREQKNEEGDIQTSMAVDLLREPSSPEQKLNLSSTIRPQLISEQRINQQLVQLNAPQAAKQSKQFALLGEFRDKELIVPLGQPIEGVGIDAFETFEHLREYLSKWVGKTINIITKEGFHGYFTDEMNELQTRVFVCSNIILNFHEMLTFLHTRYNKLWERHREEIIHLFQDCVIKSLTFYLVKYPQKNKIFLSEELKSIVSEVNDSNLPQYNMLKKFGVPFNPIQIIKKDIKAKEPKDGNNENSAPAEITTRETDYDYAKKIKKLLNVLISESKSHYYEFKELMTDVLSVGKEDGTRSPLPDHKICMKFKEDMSQYTEDEINNPGVPIKSPEVLRVLIKWIEELDAIVAKPKQNLLERQQKGLFNMNLLQAHMKTQYYKELVAAINENRDKEFNQNSSDRSILDSAYKSLSDYIHERKGQFSYLPDSIVKSGMTVNLLSTLTYDIAVLYLKRQISFIYQMHQIAYDKMTAGGTTRFLKQDEQLITFSVSDLLRAKCSGTIEEVQQVINNIRSKEGVKIVKIRNRLATGNRDFLVNFMFGECKLICEVQIGLKDSGEAKGSYLNHFNHFLYQLRRSKFGPLSESALIIANQVDIGAYFKQQIQPLKKSVKRVDFVPIFVPKEGLKIEGFKPEDSEFTFLCNNCLELTCSRLFPPWKKDNEDEFVCGSCIYKSLDRQRRAEYIMKEQAGLFFEQVAWTQEKEQRSEYISVITDESLGYINVYSSYRPANHSLEAIRKEDPTISKALENIEFNEFYYMCFEKLEEFYGEELIKNKKVFKLRPEIIILVLKFNMIVPRTHIFDIGSKKNLSECMVDCPENKQKLPYPDNSLYSICWTFSSQLSSQPERFDIVRCAVDIQRKAILILDVMRESADIGQAEISFLNRKVDNTIDRRWLLEWDYSKREFDDETFKGLPDDNSVETIVADQNNFTRIDFFRSRSLQKLCMNLNKIKSLQVKDNYPNLRELNLVNNQIEVLDLTTVDLPVLEILNVSNNRIKKIATKREKTGQVVATSESLLVLNMRFNRLDKWDVLQTDFPKLNNIALSWNRQLTEIDMTGFEALQQFRAAFTNLTKLTFRGEYPALEKVLAVFTKLEEVDMSDAVTPCLGEINFSQAKLRKLKLPAITDSLYSILLGYNFLKEFKLERTEPGKPNLKRSFGSLNKLDLSWNRLQRVDLTALPIQHCLNSLDLTRNPKLKLILPAKPFTVSGVPITRDAHDPNNEEFRLWRLYVVDWEVQEKFAQVVIDYSYGSEKRQPHQIIESMYYITDTTYIENCRLSEEDVQNNKNSMLHSLNIFDENVLYGDICQDKVDDDWKKLFSREEEEIEVYQRKGVQQTEDVEQQDDFNGEMDIARDYVPDGPPPEMDEVGGPIAASLPPPLPSMKNNPMAGDQPDVPATQPQQDDDDIELAVETMQVPEGTECVDCHRQLILPYYYYFTSKVHRCIDCAEKQNMESPEKMKRYAVNENGILMAAAGRIVDVKRCGRNIQPTNEEECSTHHFGCNGCGGGANGEARYICMGCRREPNNGDMVDFCYQCVKNLRNEYSIEANDIMQRCTKDGHRKHHCLLRVLWGVNGYYDY